MTKFTEIYEEFKDKITDYDIALLSEETQQEVLFSYLKKAISRFARLSTSNLNNYVENDGFIDDLNYDEIDILTEWMVYFWLKPIKNNIDNMRSMLNTKDFSKTSSASLLSAVNAVYKESYKQARSLMNEYSYIKGDISSLTPR